MKFILSMKLSSGFSKLDTGKSCTAAINSVGRIYEGCLRDRRVLLLSSQFRGLHFSCEELHEGPRHAYLEVKCRLRLDTIRKFGPIFSFYVQNVERRRKFLFKVIACCVTELMHLLKSVLRNTVSLSPTLWYDLGICRMNTGMPL
jgi:hypothetical protein